MYILILKIRKLKFVGGVDLHSTQEGCRWGGRGREERGVDRHSTQEGCRWGGRERGGGSIDIQLRKVVSGEGVEGRGVNRQSTWKGSAKTLQGLPLTMLILGGLIDSQLGKDSQRLCKDYL